MAKKRRRRTPPRDSKGRFKKSGRKRKAGRKRKKTKRRRRRASPKFLGLF